MQGVVYRRVKAGLEFLVVKRVPTDGGFWQAVTGTIEDGEDEVTTLKRELAEEAGITDPLYISELLHTYEWAVYDLQGTDHVFAVEVRADSDVKLEPTEHDEFMWLPLEQAVNKLKYDGNKTSMQQVNDYIKALKPEE